jgi:hypothetical protein
MSRYPGWREMAEEDLRRGKRPVASLAAAVAGTNKFHARKTTLDGQTFDSAHEARIWQELTLEQQAGELSDLQRQRVFPLIVKAKDGLPVLVGRFTADFVCRRDGKLQVVEAKSRATRTEAYQLRKKLFEALYGLRIHER